MRWLCRRKHCCGIACESNFGNFGGSTLHAGGLLLRPMNFCIWKLHCSLLWLITKVSILLLLCHKNVCHTMENVCKVNINSSKKFSDLQIEWKRCPNAGETFDTQKTRVRTTAQQSRHLRLHLSVPTSLYSSKSTLDVMITDGTIRVTCVRTKRRRNIKGYPWYLNANLTLTLSLTSMLTFRNIKTLERRDVKTESSSWHLQLTPLCSNVSIFRQF